MDAESLSLFRLGQIILAGGAFGGFISALLVADLHHVTKKNTKPIEEKPRCTFLFCIGRIIIGTGGAFAVAFAGFWTHTLKIDSTADNIFVLFGVCLLSGVYGIRFLKQLGDQIESRIGKAEQQAQQAAETAEEVDKKMDHVGEYVALLNAGRSALGQEGDISPEANADRDAALEGLLRLTRTYPSERALFILIGRLYRKKKDYDRAILILRDFACNLRKLSPVTEMNETMRSDYADAYYNIACYHALKANAEQDRLEKERLNKEVVENLRESIELLPSNRQYAKLDQDFSGMRSNEDFKKLVD